MDFNLKPLTSEQEAALKEMRASQLELATPKIEVIEWTTGGDGNDDLAEGEGIVAHAFTLSYDIPGFVRFGPSTPERRSSVLAQIRATNNAHVIVPEGEDVDAYKSRYGFASHRTAAEVEALQPVQGLANGLVRPERAEAARAFLELQRQLTTVEVQVQGQG